MTEKVKVCCRDMTMYMTMPMINCIPAMVAQAKRVSGIVPRDDRPDYELDLPNLTSQELLSLISMASGGPYQMDQHDLLVRYNMITPDMQREYGNALHARPDKAPMDPYVRGMLPGNFMKFVDTPSLSTVREVSPSANTFPVPCVENCTDMTHAMGQAVFWGTETHHSDDHDRTDIEFFVDWNLLDNVAFIMNPVLKVQMPKLPDGQRWRSDVMDRLFDTCLVTINNKAFEAIRLTTNNTMALENGHYPVQFNNVPMDNQPWTITIPLELWMSSGGYMHMKAWDPKNFGSDIVLKNRASPNTLLAQNGSEATIDEGIKYYLRVDTVSFGRETMAALGWTRPEKPLPSAHCINCNSCNDHPQTLPENIKSECDQMVEIVLEKQRNMRKEPTTCKDVIPRQLISDFEYCRSVQMGKGARRQLITLYPGFLSKRFRGLIINTVSSHSGKMSHPSPILSAVLRVNGQQYIRYDNADMQEYNWLKTGKPRSQQNLLSYLIPLSDSVWSSTGFGIDPTAATEIDLDLELNIKMGFANWTFEISSISNNIIECSENGYFTIWDTKTN